MTSEAMHAEESRLVINLCPYFCLLLQGVGTDIIDPFEMFRKSKSHSYGRSSPPMSESYRM